MQSEDTERRCKQKIFEDVTHHSKPFWLTRLFVRRHFIIAFLVAIFYAVMLAVIIDYNLFNIITPTYRDFFLSDDIRT